MEDAKRKESLLLRGICSALTNMSLPTMQNLKDLLKQVGYKATIEKE